MDMDSAATLACAAALHAQAPSVAPTTLDNHLNQWAQKMKGVESLVGPFIRTEEDKTFQTPRSSKAR